MRKVDEANTRTGVTSSNPSVQNKKELGDKQELEKDGLVAASVPRKKSFSNFFSRKHKRSSKKTNSSGTLTPETTSSIKPEALGSEGAVSAATEQIETAQKIQAKAPITSKLKWIRQKKDFVTHVDEIRQSNDLISHMVSMIALGSIHNILIVPELHEDVPELLLSVQDSLDRLHHALNRSNSYSSKTRPVAISLRVMNAKAYVQLKNKLTIQHNYINFHSDSAVYPLQLQPPTAPSSTVVLAETMLATQGSTQIMHETVIPLAEKLSGLQIDTDEAFKEIGSIFHAEGSNDVHYLFEDISTSWIVQDTLADLVETKPKFLTYIQLAIQVSMSYIYCVSIGASHRYPRLADYRYYKPIEDENRSLGPNDILEPYLSVGFGSRAPRKSTKDIGGASSQFSGNEALTCLGLLLHQLGCWKRLNDEDLASARDVAKTQRKDLQTSTGICYTEVVDVCFAAKEDDWDPRVRTEKLYQKVVAPLQKLVADLHWD